MSRQRLLTAALSLGMQNLVELWLHKSKAIKPGASVKHEWFSAEPKNLKTRLIGALTKDLDTLKNSERILSLAREIERNRNDMVYGAPLPDDKALKEKIDYLIELKKSIEEAVDVVLW